MSYGRVITDEIKMCWDGQTSEAVLIINDIEYFGPPKFVQKMFDLLNKHNDKLLSLYNNLKHHDRLLTQARNTSWVMLQDLED